MQTLPHQGLDIMERRLAPGQHTMQLRVPTMVKLLALLVVAVSLLACPMASSGLAPATATPHQASVQWAGAGGTLTGEVFLPASRDQLSRFPAIVLLHGCGGLYTQRGQLTGRHRDWAQRFAAWGFVALLVDSLGRSAPSRTVPFIRGGSARWTRMRLWNTWQHVRTLIAPTSL